ncbi:hypothetical protein ACIBHX_46990 [Nonomuraea sp. NPDC050536]|uniref:hypothetical protein n=1 Tax=Nonomuraea sp. NPDC050536 TaxID=3364366 RepID=UPI0037CA7488
MQDPPSVGLPALNSAGFLLAYLVDEQGNEVKALVSWQEEVMTWSKDGGFKSRRAWFDIADVRCIPSQDYSPSRVRRVTSEEEASAPTPAEAIAPEGWPLEVKPPQAEDWPASAAAWLLDAIPSGYRAYPALREYPLLLAWMATRHVAHELEAVRQSYRGAAVDLKGHLQPHAVEAVLNVHSDRGGRLKQLQQQVTVVTQALLRGDSRPID